VKNGAAEEECTAAAPGANTAGALDPVEFGIASAPMFVIFTKNRTELLEELPPHAAVPARIVRMAPRDIICFLLMFSPDFLLNSFS
jgi:hypothetical protein